MHPKSQLEGTEIRPKRSFGQNFLHDVTHQQGIARLVMKRATDAERTVLEMGPGLGALTAALLAEGASVHAVERDRDLVPLLKQRFNDQDMKLVVHEGNALTHPLDVIAGGGAVCGNLPYHHAAELCMRALEVWPKLGGAVFLVQLEVGERMAAPPGSKTYGALSVILQSRFDVKLARVVPKGAFWPVPEVDGGVVDLSPLRAPRGGEHPLETLRSVVKLGFSQRRKTLGNTLKPLPDRDAVLAEAGIDKAWRAEVVDVATWGKLAGILAARGWTGTAEATRDKDDDETDGDA